MTIDFFFAGGLPWWATALIALGTSLLLFFHFLGLKRRLDMRKSSVLTFLRSLVYAILILFLASPSVVERRETKLRPPLAVLIDASASMGLPADPSDRAATRIDTVKTKLLEGKDPWLRRLAEDYDLRLYRFGTELEPITAQSLARLSPSGRGSRLLEAVREAGAHGLTGLILFSDGIANGERLSDGSSFAFPVFTVGAGETRGYADIRIAGLSVPEFAFRGREFKVDFTVQAYGFTGKDISVYFNRGPGLVSRHSIRIDRDPFEKRITLGYTPKEIGLHSFSLTVPPQTGELITQNNHKEFKIEVRRDKIRVLTLSGSPSWNYRFLRMALKQDPSIDLVSFVFLRTPTDSVDVPDNQLSLIPFPIDEIFLEELKNFDVLIFDDFSHRSYFNALYLERVRDFVREGGGLAMLGGTRSFDSGGYAETALRDVLPVELEGKGRFLLGENFRALLTPAGRAHPITRLLPDPKANEESWKEMPALTTLNRVTRAKGETLLLAGRDGATTSPLLVVGGFEKGRTLALLSDDFWRWNFVAAGAKQSPQNHLRLMRQAVRWLAREAAFEQVEIGPVAGPGAPGEKMKFKLRALKEDFTPTPHASLQVRIEGPEGEKIPLEAVPETQPGDYSAEFTPTKEGSYRVEVEAYLEGKTLGRAVKSFSVIFPYGELEDGRPRPELLKKLAEASKGEFMPIAQWNEEAVERIKSKLERAAPSKIVERRQVPLGSNPWVFVLLLSLLGAEWWLRRSWGLI